MEEKLYKVHIEDHTSQMYQYSRMEGYKEIMKGLGSLWVQHRLIDNLWSVCAVWGIIDVNGGSPLVWR